MEFILHGDFVNAEVGRQGLAGTVALLVTGFDTVAALGLHNLPAGQGKDAGG